MKDFLVKAKIRTDRFSNTGILHVQENLIEGLFTFDYVKILLDGNKMSLILNEHIFEFNSDHSVHKTSIIPTIYEAKYDQTYLESPLSYILFDATGEGLSLILTDPIKDPFQISHILEKLEKFKT